MHWWESLFGQDYLEIYASVLTPEASASQVDGIISILDLEPGARILDLACGHGRHSIELALRGYQVTGYDLSDLFLEKARVDAELLGAKVEWIQGDMRELAFDREFDAVINVFTAFGYFADPQDDLKTLRAVHKALRPGGGFLMETIHRDGLPARFARQGFERTPGGWIVLHEREWDLAEDLLKDEVTVIKPDGSRTAYRTSVRMRSLSQLLRLVREAGLEPESWFGGLDGGPLELNSRRLVLVSRRAPSEKI